MLYTNETNNKVNFNNNHIKPNKPTQTYCI